MVIIILHIIACVAGIIWGYFLTKRIDMILKIILIAITTMSLSSCGYIMPGFEEALEETEIKISIDKEAEKPK